jgi:hypothetical protein
MLGARTRRTWRTCRLAGAVPVDAGCDAAPDRPLEDDRLATDEIVKEDLVELVLDLG